VLHELESRVKEELSYVFLPPRLEAVDADYLVAFGHQPIAEMATEKSGPSRY